MRYENAYRPMPATADAAEFLGLTPEEVFWAQVDWGVTIANNQVNEGNAVRNALYKSEYYWMWVFLIWESTDQIVKEQIIRKDDCFHVLDKDSASYSSFTLAQAKDFYTKALHKPRYEHTIPVAAYREARAFAKAMPLATLKQSLIETGIKIKSK